GHPARRRPRGTRPRIGQPGNRPNTAWGRDVNSIRYLERCRVGTRIACLPSAQRRAATTDQGAVAMRCLRPLVLVLVIALALALVRDAAAGMPTEQLRERIDRAVGILEDGGLKTAPAARRAALRTVAGEIFDFTEITRRALGPHWLKATQAERDELRQCRPRRMHRPSLARRAPN